jgi:predicted 3-demethylubiquinone-9 3-methyltransferase (glyoxalase superfamily)
MTIEHHTNFDSAEQVRLSTILDLFPDHAVTFSGAWCYEQNEATVTAAIFELCGVPLMAIQSSASLEQRSRPISAN